MSLDQYSPEVQSAIQERIDLIDRQDEVGVPTASYIAMWKEADPNIESVYFSKSVEGIMGYTRDEMLKIGLRSVFSAILTPGAEFVGFHEIQQRRTTGELTEKLGASYEQSYRATRKDGKEIYVDDLATIETVETATGEKIYLAFGNLFNSSSRVEPFLQAREAEKNLTGRVDHLEKELAVVKEDLEKDRFTNLMDKAHALSVLSQEYEKCDDYSLMFIDLDHFKHLNDTCGHGAGDIAIRAIADLLRECIRSDREGECKDIPCRVGGDEFAILLPETSEEEAIMIRDRIEHRIEEEKAKGEDGMFKIPSEKLASFGASIGIVNKKSSKLENWEDFYKASDVEMYTVKGERKFGRRSRPRNKAAE